MWLILCGPADLRRNSVSSYGRLAARLFIECVLSNECQGLSPKTALLMFLWHQIAAVLQGLAFLRDFQLFANNMEASSFNHTNITSWVW